MGKLVFGMMQSLDGYVAGVAGGPGSDGYVAGLAAGLELPPPGVSLARHFNDHFRGLAGGLCGRRIYELMRYRDEDQPELEAVEHDFAAVWRARPKWVVSRSLKSVGANATLVASDVEAFVRRLKAEVEGEIDVAGPELPPVCAWPRQAVFRRCQAAPPTYRRRSRRRGCGQADVRPYLITLSRRPGAVGLASNRVIHLDSHP